MSKSLRFFFTLLISCYSTFLSAQAPAWMWTSEAFTSNTEFAKDVAIDPISGDVVVAGHFTGDISAHLGSSFSGAAGGGFVARYNSVGNLLWAFRVGDNDNDRCNGVTVDSSGNIYITGYLTLNCDFRGLSSSPLILASSGSKDVFVAKYTSGGFPLWARADGGNTGDDEGNSLTVSGNRVYVAGTYRNNAGFGSITTVSGINRQNLFVAAYDTDGTELWVAEGAAPAGAAVGYDVTAAAGIVYVAGDFETNLRIYDGNGTLQSTLTAGTEEEAIVLAFNSSGTYQWTNHITGTGKQRCRSVTEKGGSIYITGGIDNTSSFPGYSPVTPSLSGLDLYVASISKSTGITTWVQTEAGSNDQEGLQLSFTADQLLVTGYFNTNIAFTGGPNLVSSGGDDVFIGAYQTTGTFLWAMRAGGPSDERAHAIAGNTSSDTYLAGEYSQDAVFGSQTLSSQSGANIFVSKLGCPVIASNSTGPPQTICTGSTPSTISGSIPSGGTTPYLFLWEQSSDNITFTPAAGINSLQNYSPPALTASTYYRRKVTASGYCSNSSLSPSVLITVDSMPATAVAGADQAICSDNTSLSATIPTTGTGAWTLISGGGTIANISDPVSAVTSLAAGANVFRWTVSNGVCPASFDEVLIDRSATPTTAVAGTDQIVCSTNASLTANIPAIGSGNWSLVSGSGIITSPGMATTAVSGLATGANIFRWTISNGSCTPSFDDIIIQVDAEPTTSDAGPDQIACSTTALLAANAPSIGTGTWTRISGTGTVTDPSNPSSTVTGLLIGTSVFRWTISNGTCTPSFDDMIMTVMGPISTSNAGTDQTICSTTAVMSANTPVVGTGTWTVISGSGSFSDANSPSTTVTGIGPGTNVFRWSIENGFCSPSFDDVLVTRDLPPSIANAGADIAVCSETGTLNADLPLTGTGIWTVLSGTANVSTAGSPTSSVNSLSTGNNVFVWTVSNGVCPGSSDTVVINRNTPPSVAVAGADQVICSASTTMTAVVPSTGSGVWSVISGAGTFASPANSNSALTSIQAGINTYVWTVSNGVCPVSADTIIVQRDTPPDAANAGSDQTICSSTTTITGNIPVTGTGNWTLVSGTGTISDPSNPFTSLTSLSPGSNIFRWTISNGVCPAVFDDVTIIVDNFPTAANAGFDSTICTSFSTLNGNTPAIGSGMWTVVAGSASVSNSASPNSAITGLTVGTNTFVWTLSNGTCPNSTDTVHYYVDPFPTVANAGFDSTICSSSSILNGNTPAIGTGMWSVIAGTATVTNPTSPSSTITGLTVGTNTFVWTISNGTCPISTDTVHYYVDPLPTVANAGPDSTICSSMSALNGNAPAIGTGLWTVIAGTGSVTNPTSPTSAITGLTVGTNTFVWTISNGTCPGSSDTVHYYVDPFPTTASAGFDSTICSSSSALNGNIPSVGTGAWTVIVGTASVINPTSPNSAITGMTVGTSTFGWTITNGTCPSSTDTVHYYVDPLPTVANAGSDSTICSAVSTLNGNTPAIGTGVWTVIAGSASVSDPTSPNSLITGLSVGTNTFVWTISNGTCPSSSDTVHYYVDPFPTSANAGFDSTICSSSSLLNGNAPSIGTGLWTVIAGSATVTSPSSPVSGITGLMVGTNTFVWTVSNGTCPGSTDTVHYYVDPLPTIANAGFDSTICSSSSSLNGNTPGIGTGLWTVVAGGASVITPSSPNTAITGLTVGTNTFVWTISNGTCPASTDTVHYSVDPFPTIANAGFDSTICSSSSTLNGNTPSIGTGMWTVITGPAIVTNPTSANSGITGLTVGTNTFVWTISNGTCPSSSDTVHYYVDPLPTIANAGFDSTICSSASSLNGNTPSIGTGLWTVIAGSATVSNPTSPGSVISGLTVGTNTFVWTISNGTCPGSTDTVHYFVDPFPTIANAGYDSTICSSSSSLNGNSPSEGTGLWTVVAGTASVTDPTSPNSAITGLTVGTSTFVWTISNGTCPSTFDTVNYIVDAMPSIANAGFDSTICASSTVLTGNIPTIGTGFWTSSNGSIIADPASYLTSVSSLSTGTNTFTWTISNGTCPSSSDIVTVMVDANPSIADAGPDITTHLLTADLSASIPMVGSGNWTLVSGSADFLNNSDPQTPVEHLKHGENVLRWTISNGTCPSVSDDVVVTVHPIILPSGFSPNGDNVNDYFEVPDIEELGTVALEVYNRWGNLVYSDGEYKNNWDGKSNDGSDLSDDTYYYMLQVGDTRSFKGYIVIKRK